MFKYGCLKKWPEKLALSLMSKITFLYVKVDFDFIFLYIKVNYKSSIIKMSDVSHHCQMLVVMVVGLGVEVGLGAGRSSSSSSSSYWVVVFKVFEYIKSE